MVVATQKIPSGYKQTEIGVIPADWDIKKIIDFTDCTAGGTPSTLRQDYWGGSIPWMNSGELNNKKIFGVEGRITETGLKESSTKIIPANSVLVGLAGQGKTRGTVAISRIDLCINQSIAAIYPSSAHNSDYLYFNFDNRYDEIRSLSTGGEGRGGLNLSIIRQIFVAFPSREEQARIASVLSDADILIKKLEKLIEKKKNIKIATTQQLLSGRMRLPGFGREWEWVELELLLDYEQPTKYLVASKKYSDAYDVPVLTVGKTFILGYTDESRGIFADLPCIIFDDFTTESRFVDFPFKAKSSAMKMLLPKSETVNLRYVYEAMHQTGFKLGDHKRYWISEYRHLKIPLPGPEEQEAIVEVLVEMELEISSLKKQKEKFLSIKQGMLHELLTGSTRLI